MLTLVPLIFGLLTLVPLIFGLLTLPLLSFGLLTLLPLSFDLLTLQLSFDEMLHGCSVGSPLMMGLLLSYAHAGGADGRGVWRH